MNVNPNSLGDKKTICIILLFFFLIKLFTLSYYKIIWWDSAVYIGMGKHIFSLGSVGLWEGSRPIVWPLILGILWRSGLAPILFGRVAEIIFGGLCILMTYLIGKRLFGENQALLASVFLALSPTFFFFNGIMLTEIISTFFALLAFFFLIKKKMLASGIFFGIAFMARFLQLLAFLSALLIILSYSNKGNKNVKTSLTLIFTGFFIAIAPYLVLNFALYKNPFLPFLQQIYLSGNSGWLNYRSISYYFLELFKENLLYPLPFLGAFLIFMRLKNRNNKEKMLLATTFFLFFVFFNSIKQKEIRFLIVLLPYMYLLMAGFIGEVHKTARSKILRYSILAIVILSLSFSFIKTSAYYKDENGKYNVYAGMQKKFQEEHVKGNIWVSNPIIPVLAENKSVKLMYYPTFNETIKERLIKEDSDFIFLDFCDLACMPEDANCNASKIRLLNFLKSNFKEEYHSIKNGCGQYVFISS